MLYTINLCTTSTEPQNERAQYQFFGYFCVQSGDTKRFQVLSSGEQWVQAQQELLLVSRDNCSSGEDNMTYGWHQTVGLVGVGDHRKEPGNQLQRVSA